MQNLLVHELQSCFLLFPWLWFVSVSCLVLGTIGDSCASDVACHMTAIAFQLSGYLVVHATEVVAIQVLGIVLCPFFQSAEFIFQVLYAIGTCLHGIIAQVLSLASGVESAFISLSISPPQAWVLLALCCHLFHELVVLILIFCIRQVGVSPFDGPVVIIIDTWEDAFASDVVLGLCHIVEACIVHDAGGVSVCFHPFLVAQAVHGYCA